MTTYEVNMDGLVGPTHHYAGLSPGNLASTQNALTRANPAAAALQGLTKMRLLHQMGIKQAILPPHARPNFHLLNKLGFTGSPAHILQMAHKESPILLSAAYSASSMWTANSATVCPSTDSVDHKVHFTPANLISNLHRHQETSFTGRMLKHIFSDKRYFTHHDPLPTNVVTSDEGAANHNRFCAHHSARGIHLFVYGKYGLTTKNDNDAPQLFPARQTLEASQAIARSLQLEAQSVLFARQNPKAIDQGVFHNDVISVANESVFLCHQEAFVDQKEVLRTLKERVQFPLQLLEVPSTRISVKQAVDSYLFNSQLISLPTEPKSMVLIAPSECYESPHIKTYLDEILADEQNPIIQVYYLNLKQSMRNGGGPACLRLRVCLTEEELNAMHQGILVNDSLLLELEQWVKRNYRGQLHADDLVDPNIIHECHVALDELTTILKLGSIYPFQQT
jgi:succinylarginine dihydrolase